MLRPADFIELERLAGGFVHKNHHRFLSEALASLRQSRDPVAAFELLARMQDGARKDEADALLDILAWLRSQLRAPVRLDADDLELRLVWTRRLARIAESRTTSLQDRSRGDARPAAPRSQVLDAEIRQLRQKYPRPPPQPAPPCPPRFQPGPVASPGRPPLPHLLEVMFTDHRDAVTTLKRLVDGSATRPGVASRPPRPLPLSPPVGRPAFPPDLGPVFLACTATTPGLAAYLKALRTAHHGAAFPFCVTALEYDGARIFARELLLSPPEASRLES